MSRPLKPCERCGLPDEDGHVCPVVVPTRVLVIGAVFRCPADPLICLCGACGGEYPGEGPERWHRCPDLDDWEPIWISRRKHVNGWQLIERCPTCLCRVIIHPGVTAIRPCRIFRDDIPRRCDRCGDESGSLLACWEPTYQPFLREPKENA